MKNFREVIAAVLMIVFAFSGCSNNTDYIVGSQVNLSKLSQSMNSSVTGANNTPAALSDDTIPVSREDLGDMRSVIKVYDSKNIGDLKVPGFGNLSLGKDEKNLNVYYIETKTVLNNGKPIVYGVGYSIHFLFKKVKKGLSLDKLPFIAASVQLDGGKTEVYYSIHSYGMKGLPLVKYFRPVINKPFDVEGFGIMQASIDGIQNSIGDTTMSKLIKFRPQVFTNIAPAEL